MSESKISNIQGIQIIESPYLTELIEDWSRVRSPSRAIRRRKRGFKQNIEYRQVPSPNACVMSSGKIIMHPDTARKVYEQLEEENARIS